MISQQFRVLALIICALAFPAKAEHPDVKQASQDMTAAMQGRDAKLALDTAMHIVGKRPKDPDALVLRAKLYMMMRKGDQAMTDIQAALALDPHHPTATQIMANHEFQQGKKKEAETRVDAALAKYPKSVEMIAMKADLLKASGDAAQALKVLNRGWEAVKPDKETSKEHKGMLLAKVAEFQAAMGQSERAGKSYLEATTLIQNNPQLHLLAIQQLEKAEQWRLAAETANEAIKVVNAHPQLNAAQKKAMVEQFATKAREFAEKIPNHGADFAKLQEKLDEGWDLEDFLYELEAKHRENDILGNIFDDRLSPEERAKQLRNQVRMTPKHWAYIRQQLEKRAAARPASPTELAVEALLDHPGDPEKEQAVAEAHQKAMAALEIDDKGRVALGAHKDGSPRMGPYREAIIPDHIFLTDQGFQMVWYEKRDWRKARFAHRDHPNHALNQAHETWYHREAVRQLQEKLRLFPSHEDYEALALYAIWQKDLKQAATAARVAAALLAYENAHTFAPKGLRDTAGREERLRGIIDALDQNLSGTLTTVDKDLDAVRKAALNRRWQNAAEAYSRIIQRDDPEIKGALSPEELASHQMAVTLCRKLRFTEIHDKMVWGAINGALAARNKNDPKELERYSLMIRQHLSPSGNVEADLFELEQKKAKGELKPTDFKFRSILRNSPKRSDVHLLKGQVHERAGETNRALVHYLTAKLCAKGASPAEHNLKAVENRLGIKNDEQRKKAYLDAINSILKGGYQREDAGVVDSLALAMQQLGMGGNLDLIRVQALSMGGEHDAATKLADQLTAQNIGNQKIAMAKRRENAAEIHSIVAKNSYLNHQGRLEALKTATQHYEKAIEYSDQPVATHHSGCGMSWSEIAKRSGEGHEQAVKHLTMGIKLGINNASMYMARSKSHEMLGNYPEAADDARQALTIYQKKKEKLSTANQATSSGHKIMMANMDMLTASEQLRRVGEKMMLASLEKMEVSMKRFDKIAEENPEALKELERAMKEQDRKESEQLNK